ncbi:MAG: hypothetical protein JWR26_2318 [Pedosphaera sp.]|nr:hypothetical protein [Pedosphaera sp.]
MSDSKSCSNHATTFPVLALLFASAVSVILTGFRVIQTGHWGYLTLSWNLFLAWLPLVFALGVGRLHRSARRNSWKLYSLGGLWLLFFPNAPYIFTDLIHLNTWFRDHYWVDLTLILLVALTGFLLGFISLYLMQSMVADRVGRAASWLFILVVAGLSGFGIYLGRILRWNSWDVLIHPVGLSQDIGRWAAHPLANSTSVAFPVAFAIFLFVGYLMLYALTHLQPAQARDLAA